MRTEPFLLIRELTDFTAVEQARRGTTVDYYLSDATRDDDFPFNRSARLEVSGIFKEEKANTIDRRTKSKQKRLIDDDLPAYIVVVEFGQPQAKITVVKS